MEKRLIDFIFAIQKAVRFHRIKNLHDLTHDREIDYLSFKQILEIEKFEAIGESFECNIKLKFEDMSEMEFKINQKFPATTLRVR